MLSLTDSHAPWNNGVYQLVWSMEGTVRLERIEELGNAGVVELTLSGTGGGISCDIQALTAMLVGNRKPSWLHETCRINGTKESIELLERRIPNRTTHLMDFF
jgi:predicted acetyltransferase